MVATRGVIPIQLLHPTKSFESMECVEGIGGFGAGDEKIVPRSTKRRPRGAAKAAGRVSEPGLVDARIESLLKILTILKNLGNDARSLLAGYALKYVQAMRQVIELKFVAMPEKGEVSALLFRPADATDLLILSHGASTNMLHATLERIATRMADVGIATFRYNFPYMEKGTARDPQQVCTATVRSAVAAGHAAAPDLPLLAGGHSFGGRMTSTAAAEAPLASVRGLVFFSFPLHQPGKPDIKRALHLSAVSVPMLFLSGTRDELARLDLLRPVCARLGSRATLHLLDTADHGYRTLKRSRTSTEDVFIELARVTCDWARTLR